MGVFEVSRISIIYYVYVYRTCFRSLFPSPSEEQCLLLRSSRKRGSRSGDENTIRLRSKTDYRQRGVLAIIPFGCSFGSNALTNGAIALKNL